MTGHTLDYVEEYSTSKCEESNTSRSVYHSSLVSIVGTHVQCSNWNCTQIEVKWKLQDVAVSLLVDRMKDSKQYSKWEWSKSDDQEIQTGITKCVERKDEEKNAANK